MKPLNIGTLILCQMTIINGEYDDTTTCEKFHSLCLVDFYVLYDSIVKMWATLFFATIK